MGERIRRLSKLSLLFFLLFSLPDPASAQDRIIRGKVTSADDGEGLPGVNIQVQGTTRGTVTDFEGNYSLELQAGDNTLLYSFIGYQTATVEVGSRSVVDVALELDIEELQEIVVVGYGTVRKSDLTGAVASVKSEDITKIPNANPVQALQGKVSGLQILNSSGDPGAAPVVRLRGITTLNNNNPIFVVDGVIIEEGNSLDFLNANDIESVEVLKDASATAIFGSRGSNGVIIVTTKRGAKGDVRINYSAEQGWETIAKKIDVMTGREFAQYVNDITPGTYNNLDLLPNVDWQDEIYSSYTPISSHSLSMSSANDKVDYYFGLGYFGQEGILPESELKRLTTKINTTYKVTKDINVGLNLSVALKNKLNPPGVVATALRAWPIDEPFGTDPNTGERIFKEVNGGGNALAAIEYSNNNTKSFESVGNIYADYKFLDGFTFKTSYQFTFGLDKNRAFTPEFFVAPLQQNETSDLSVSYGERSFLLWENTLSYDKEIGIHRINAVAGYTTQTVRGESLGGTTQNLLRDDPSFWYLDAGQQDLETTFNSGSHSSILSMLFRANYVLSDKYLFTATFRRDGSSKFGPNSRYGNFPSVAVGWNISDEPFFPQTKFVGNMKIRASWGVVGNDKINYSSQYSLISSGADAVFGTNEALNPGASYSSGGNPNLKWEETEQFDVGMNFDMLNSRFTAELDYYVKNTNDILVSLEPVGYTGIGAFGTITYNVASVRNKGFEFNLNWQDDIGNFSYKVGALGSTVSNEVLNLGQNIGADSLVVAGDLGNGQQVSRTAVGLPIGFFYGYDVIGVFQNQEQLNSTPHLFNQGVGDFIYRDANGDGVLNADDRVMIGSSIPSFIYGFSAEVGYKGVKLSADFQGQSGVDIYNGKQAVRFSLLNYESKFNERWTGENSTNEHPRAASGGVNFSPSNYFIENGSFLRLRTLTLNYSFPSSLIDKLSIGSLAVYARATNLFTQTRFTGYSPDLGADSALDGVIDRGVYPTTKIYSLGLNVTF